MLWNRPKKNENYAICVKNVINFFLSRPKFLDDACSKLGLDKIKKSICDSPNFLYCIRYSVWYNFKAATKTSILPILMKNYDKEIF